MPKNSNDTKTPLTDNHPEVTPAIHNAVRDWWAERKDYFNMSLIAREAKCDPSFCRKVLVGTTTPNGTAYEFTDETVRALYALTLFIGQPCKLPGVKVSRVSK